MFDSMGRTDKPFLLRRIVTLSRDVALIFGPRSRPTQVPDRVSSVRFRSDSGVEGFLDSFGPSRIHGWVHKPGVIEPLVIALYDGERYICIVTADRARPDLAKSGKPNSHCGFDMPVPDTLRDGRQHSIDMRIAGTSISLLSRPVVIKIEKMTATATATKTAQVTPAVTPKPAVTPTTNRSSTAKTATVPSSGAKAERAKSAGQKPTKVAQGRPTTTTFAEAPAVTSGPSPAPLRKPEAEVKLEAAAKSSPDPASAGEAPSPGVPTHKPAFSDKLAVAPKSSGSPRPKKKDPQQLVSPIPPAVVTKSSLVANSDPSVAISARPSGRAVGSRPPMTRPDNYLGDQESDAALRNSMVDRLALEGENAGAAVESLIRRLRRERAIWRADTMMEVQSAGTLVMTVTEKHRADALASLNHWKLQSHPYIDAMVITNHPASFDAEGVEVVNATDPETIRGALAAAEWCIFARAGDVLAPSTVTLLNRTAPSIDCVLWSMFSSTQSGVTRFGLLHRRPPFDPHTIRHNPSIDSGFAVRGRALSDCPLEVLLAVGAGRIHPLLFWLSTRVEISWQMQPYILTIRPAPGDSRDQRTELVIDVYQKLSEAHITDFDLRQTDPSLPVPFVLVPRRRAVKISVVITVENDRNLFRCLASIAHQRTTSETEIVLVTGPTLNRDALLTRSSEIFGANISMVVDAENEHNISASMNRGVSSATGDVIVFCRPDLVFLDPTVLEQVAAWSLQPGIGTVGCRLNETHNGNGAFAYGTSDRFADPLGPPFVPNTDETYSKGLRSTCGNTRILMAVEQSKFWAVGGFDEVRFPAGQNDVEFMLRCSRHGLTHLFLGHLAGRFTGSVSAPNSSGEPEDSGQEHALLRALYPEALERALLQLRIERVQPREIGLASSLYQTEDLELLASRALERSKDEDDRRKRLLGTVTEITDASDRLTAAVSSLQALAIGE